MSPLLTITSTVPIHYFADLQTAQAAATSDPSDGIYTTLMDASSTWCPGISCSNCPLRAIKQAIDTSSCTIAGHYLLLTAYPNLTSTNPEWFL